MAPDNESAEDRVAVSPKNINAIATSSKIYVKNQTDGMNIALDMPKQHEVTLYIVQE